MLNKFDWLRRCRTGAELLATLRHFAQKPSPQERRGQGKGKNDSLALGGEGWGEGEIGSPRSALSNPCERCWIYPHLPGKHYCADCQGILGRSWRLGEVSRSSSVIWGFVNQLPKQLRSIGDSLKGDWKDSRVLGAHVQDEHHFLVMLFQKELKPWFQELAMYHGSNLRGLIQVFPTSGSPNFTMGEVICRVMHNEARYPMDQLRVRFFASSFHVLRPHRYDRQGVLTFSVTEFLSLMEMASVFRTLLHPEEQKLLRKILITKDPQKERFYWGRFLGRLDQDARDMLNAWGVRNWSKPQTRLLYDLTDYVAYY